MSHEIASYTVSLYVCLVFASGVGANIDKIDISLQCLRILYQQFLCKIDTKVQ